VRVSSAAERIRMLAEEPVPTVCTDSGGWPTVAVKTRSTCCVLIAPVPSTALEIDAEVESAQQHRQDADCDEHTGYRVPDPPPADDV
jgi:hypothetical protein